ncbi:MAG: ribosome maturation factor RimM [Brevinema sp.]
MSIDKQEFVEIGRILKPFGIKGDLRIKFYIDEISDIKNVDVLYVKDKSQPTGFRILTISSLKFEDDPENAKISFKEIADRTTAEQWRLVPVFISKDKLVVPDEGQYFIKDLLETQAVHNNLPIGKVYNIIDVANQDIFVIKMLDSKQDLAVPFTDEYVSFVDLEKKEIIFQNLDRLL